MNEELTKQGINDTITDLSTDLNVISSEIKGYQQMAGQSIFEIGRRLKWVKENDLAHGEFGEWLKTIKLQPRQAQRFIKIFDEFPNTTTSSYLGVNVLYEIATLPNEERNKEHVTEDGEVKKPDEMTVRELRELKKQLRETQGDLHQVSSENEQLQDQLEIHEKTIAQQNQKYQDLLSKKPKTVEVPGDPVEVVPDDYEKLKQDRERFASEKKQWERRVQAAKNSEQFQREQVEALQNQLDESRKGSVDYDNMKKQLAELQSKFSDASNKLVSIKDYQTVFEKASELISTVAPIMYSGTLKYVDADSIAAQKAEDIANSMIDFGNALLDRIPHNRGKQRVNIDKDNVIEGEVNE